MSTPKASRANGSADTAEVVASILRNATLLFLERGYSDTSMNTIASSVGIKGPALYWHFKSKEELCFRILRDLLTYVNSRVESLPVDKDPAQQLRYFVYQHVVSVQKYLEKYGDTRLLYSFDSLASALTSEHQKELRELAHQFIAILDGILDAGEASGAWVIPERVVVKYAIVNLGDSVSSWFRPCGRLSIEEVANHYAALALGMAKSGEIAAELAD